MVINDQLILDGKFFTHLDSFVQSNLTTPKNKVPGFQQPEYIGIGNFVPGCHLLLKKSMVFSVEVKFVKLQPIGVK
ncbi:hypothetical protein B9Z55_023589 [Caenorhabditis nigoni]|uniref:Uncharacterized protein n=1 Tax=Caenorhabditis nigoni TaxID=1611254 RepID=A0A2G5SQE9_9PELO|nr:hypothetical protein B9Z55_023589 [Caenorhabditis nigoni]